MVPEHLKSPLYVAQQLRVLQGQCKLDCRGLSEIFGSTKHLLVDVMDLALELVLHLLVVHRLHLQQDLGDLLFHGVLEVDLALLDGARDEVGLPPLFDGREHPQQLVSSLRVQLVAQSQVGDSQRAEPVAVVAGGHELQAPTSHLAVPQEIARVLRRVGTRPHGFLA
eukprot:768318-Hanusia_phi.AAC.3